MVFDLIILESMDIWKVFVCGFLQKMITKDAWSPYMITTPIENKLVDAVHLEKRGFDRTEFRFENIKTEKLF